MACLLAMLSDIRHIANAHRTNAPALSCHGHCLVQPKIGVYTELYRSVRARTRPAGASPREGKGTTPREAKGG